MYVVYSHDSTFVTIFPTHIPRNRLFKYNRYFRCLTSSNLQVRISCKFYFKINERSANEIKKNSFLFFFFLFIFLFYLIFYILPHSVYVQFPYLRISILRNAAHTNIELSRYNIAVYFNFVTDQILFERTKLTFPSSLNCNFSKLTLTNVIFFP